MSFVVDFVVSSASPLASGAHRTFADYVYDPAAANLGVRTTAGFFPATPW